MKTSILKLLCLFFMMVQFPLHSFAEGENIDLSVAWVDPTLPNQHGQPRIPIRMPIVSKDGNILFFEVSHPTYILYVVDENGGVVLEQVVSTKQTMVELPDELQGEFCIDLVQGNLKFVGKISL